MVRYCFSHPVTFGAMPTPGTERLTPVKGNSLGTLAYKGKDHIREMNAMVRWVQISAPDSPYGRAPDKRFRGP